MAGVQIEHRKADYKVFGGFFCWNFYLKGCTSCCDGLAMCTCIACDCSVPMTSINVPALCSVLGITIYPSCACCNDVENIHKNIKKQGKELNPAKFGAKQPYRPCVACCIPGMCSINTYWLSPESCLACEATMAFLSLDGAVPPRDDIPKTCGGAMCIGPYGMPIGIPFLMCYPKCGCCLTVKDLVPNKIAPEPLDIEPIKAITAPPPNVQMTVVRQQPMVVMRQGVQVIMVRAVQRDAGRDAPDHPPADGPADVRHRAPGRDAGAVLPGPEPGDSSCRGGRPVGSRRRGHAQGRLSALSEPTGRVLLPVSKSCFSEGASPVPRAGGSAAASGA